MGIDPHAFNFIKFQSARAPLGRVLTVGRQSNDVDARFLFERLGVAVEPSKYCEPSLLALGAKSVNSVDCSDYEEATLIADLGRPLQLDRRFDTIIDFGSLEHIYDTATAFKNLIGLCEIGGRILHFLPVNNLNGHGFWQFCSDLLYSLYSERNGFCEAEVYYASCLDPTAWFKMPRARPGVRVEVVSLEPLILLSAARKVYDRDDIDVSQPFYAPMWTHEDASKDSPQVRVELADGLARFRLRRKKWWTLLRNLHLLIGLTTGSGHYALKRRCECRIDVERALTGSAT